MSKITIAELASALLEKHGLKRTEAELFIRQFVTVVNEALTADKIAKVKGLGTFKVTSVSARKSVDVNTGEPIIIQGRDKITFTADNTMRDLVNAPFAQFETVIINEGVDFSEIDERHRNELTDATSEPVTIEPETSEVVTTETVTAEPETSEPATIEPETSEVDTTETVTAEPVISQSETSEPVTIEPQTSELDTSELDTSEPDTSEPDTSEPDTSEPETSEPETSEPETSEPETSYKTWTIVLAASLTLVLSLSMAGFIYMNSQITKRDNRIEHLEAQSAKLLERIMKVHAATPDSTAIKEKADSMKTIREDAYKIQNANSTPKPKTDTVATSVKPSKYDSDPRIRLGAYIITGIDKTVTVRFGQTLSGISKAYLGPGMECYVEAVNDGKKNYNAGDKINIPALKLKKRSK